MKGDLRPKEVLTAIQAAGGQLVERGYLWDGTGFVRARGSLRFELRAPVFRADAKRGKTGFEALVEAGVRDQRVERAIRTAGLLAPANTRMYFELPLLQRWPESRLVAFPHRNELAAGAETVVAELTALAPWLDSFTDDASVLAAFGVPEDQGGLAGAAYRRGLFAIASGLESTEVATAAFLAHVANGRSPRSKPLRELWDRCAEAAAGSRAQLAASPTRYDPNARYAVGTILSHPKFGQGTVIETAGTMMTVRFADATRKLTTATSPV